MRRFIIVAMGALVSLIVGSSGVAAAEAFATEPGVFDPGATGTIVSQWVKHLGEPDGTAGNTRYGLLMSKNTATATNAAAFARIENVKGIKLTQLGYDIRNGSHCGAGSPRFNVVTTDGMNHFVGGCANGVMTPSTTQGWSQVRFDPTSPTMAFPPVTPTETVRSITLLVDEGTDAGPDFTGVDILDNIDVNGFLMGGPEGAS
jgi:hypothetical protein